MFNIFFILMAALATLNPSTTTQNTIEVTVTNIEATKGYVRLSVYNNPSKFPKENGYYKAAKIKVEGSSVKYTFKDLPQGDYAVATYHDKNSDSKCNLNFVGVPTEGYGFSRNFKPRFSAPTFDDVKFTLKGKYSCSIKLIN